MASTKVVQTDITEKAKRTLLTNVVRHAVSTVAGTAQFKDTKDLPSLVRQQAFKEEIVSFVHNQLIKEGSLEHYVVLMGTQYML